jgi:ATP/ADP translocase
VATQVKVRSIDYMGNARIATLAVGVVGVSAGGNLLWSRTIGVTAALSLVVALIAGANFLDNLERFLLPILYPFVPRTAAI